MNIHIIPHGRDTNHVKKGLRFYNSIDIVYLLPGKGFVDNSKKLKEELKKFGYRVEISEVNPFDLRSIVDTIVTIAKKHENDKIYINITGGTNLMAGGATSSAFFIGATAYYVMGKEDEEKPLKEQIKILPIPNQPLYVDITGLKRDIMEKLPQIIEEGKMNSIKELRTKLRVYPQKIHFHIKELERKGLIKTHREGRITKIEITPAGKLYLKWTS